MANSKATIGSITFSSSTPNPSRKIPVATMGRSSANAQITARNTNAQRIWLYAEAHTSGHAIALWAIQIRAAIAPIQTEPESFRTSHTSIAMLTA